MDQFEGPLGLLLHLIRQQEMDIYDIPIQKITHQYLEYIALMRNLDLEVAGDFIAMAATLIQIKSRMLVPQYDGQGGLIDDDPRQDLVQKLLEYQKYQDAAHRIYERPLVDRDVWKRGMNEFFEPDSEEEILVDEDNPLFPLISAYRLVSRKVKTGVHRIARSSQSIAQRILELRDYLLIGKRVTLRDLIEGDHVLTDKILVTFLSLLELSRLGLVALFQSENYGDIYIDTHQIIHKDIIGQVEEYESQPHTQTEAPGPSQEPSFQPVELAVGEP